MLKVANIQRCFALDDIHRQLYSLLVHAIDVQFNYSSIYDDDPKKLETKAINESEMPLGKDVV